MMIAYRRRPVAPALIETCAVAQHRRLGLAVAGLAGQVERLLVSSIQPRAIVLREHVGQVPSAIGGLALIADLQLNGQRILEAALGLRVIADIAPDLAQDVQEIGFAATLAQRLANAQSIHYIVPRGCEIALELVDMADIRQAQRLTTPIADRSRQLERLLLVALSYLDLAELDRDNPQIGQAGRLARPIANHAADGQGLQIVGAGRLV